MVEAYKSYLLSKFFNLSKFWNLIFGVATWALWRDRNTLVFSLQSSMGDELWSSVCNQVHFIENTLTNPLMSRDRHRQSSPASWSKRRLVQAYVDGAHGFGNGSSACGGLVRDSVGIFMKGLYCKVTSSNALWVGMWRILLARSLALP